MTLWQTLFGLNGRIGRGTFWLLVMAIGLLDLAFVALVSDWIHTEYLNGAIPRRPDGHFVGAGFGLLVVAVLSVWTLLSLGVKRAHDRGKSGWWLLIGLIPVYGALRVTWELGLQPGASRRNAYGDRIGRGPREGPAERRPLTLADTQAVEPETPAPEGVPETELQTLQSPESGEVQPDLFSDAPGGVDGLAPAELIASEAVIPEFLSPEFLSPEPASEEPKDVVEAVDEGEPQEPVSVATLPERSALEASLEDISPVSGADEAAAPEEPQADPPAQLKPPAMDWGRAYGADPSWPVFEPAAPASVIAASEPEAPVQTEHSSAPEPSTAPVWPEPREWWEETRFSSEAPGDEAPAVLDDELPAPADRPKIVESHAEPALPEPAPDALIWKPAPSHEAYAELGSISPRPANDPHPEREEG